MRELALHILDIAENSVAAKASNISIRINEDSTNDTLRIVVQDDGVGMTPEIAAKVTDAFYTTRTTRKVGLGLPLLKLAAESCNGFLTVSSKVNSGTNITVEFQHSHIDRMPLGDVCSTFLSLLVSYPAIHWTFAYEVDQQSFLFDDSPFKECLEGVSLTEPDVLAFLRETIQSGIAQLQPIGEI